MSSKSSNKEFPPKAGGNVAIPRGAAFRKKGTTTSYKCSPIIHNSEESVRVYEDEALSATGVIVNRPLLTSLISRDPLSIQLGTSTDHSTMQQLNGRMGKMQQQIDDLHFNLDAFFAHVGFTPPALPSGRVGNMEQQMDDLHFKLDAFFAHVGFTPPRRP